MPLANLASGCLLSGEIAARLRHGTRQSAESAPSIPLISDVFYFYASSRANPAVSVLRCYCSAKDYYDTKG